MIKCTIWKIGNGNYRITVNDIRYRKLDTACISDIDTLFSSMEEIKNVITKEQNVDIVFEITGKDEWLRNKNINLTKEEIADDCQGILDMLNNQDE